MDQQNKKVRILIIEDDEFLGEILTTHLPQGEEWEVTLSTSGSDGLEKMRATKPNILLLDLVLPGIDGYEVLRQMKADPALADIQVLILSNLGQKSEVAKGMELGAKDFLIKANYDIDDIRKKVKELL